MKEKRKDFGMAGLNWVYISERMKHVYTVVVVVDVDARLYKGNYEFE